MRLIDADALIDFIDCGHLRNPLELCFSERDVVDMLESRPTIDTVPVVRGKWKLYGNDDDSGMSYWCTVCNFQLSEDLFYSGYKNGRWIENGVFKYCPNCGAKMESEGST